MPRATCFGACTAASTLRTQTWAEVGSLAAQRSRFRAGAPTYGSTMDDPSEHAIRRGSMLLDESPDRHERVSSADYQTEIALRWEHSYCHCRTQRPMSGCLFEEGNGLAHDDWRGVEGLAVGKAGN